MDCVEFDKQQLQKLKERLQAYQEAELALITDGISSYTLDTGQTRQTVTTNDLPAIERVISRIQSQIDVYYTRVYGCGTRTTRPAW